MSWPAQETRSLLAGDHSALQVAMGLYFSPVNSVLLSNKNEFINVNSDIMRWHGRMPKEDQKPGLGEMWSDCPDASRGFIFIQDFCNF